jgi:hypothetical protein
VSASDNQNAASTPVKVPARVRMIGKWKVPPEVCRWSCLDCKAKHPHRKGTQRKVQALAEYHAVTNGHTVIVTTVIEGANARQCGVCGCTEHAACEPARGDSLTCRWVKPDLCSRCVSPKGKAR